MVDPFLIDQRFDLLTIQSTSPRPQLIACLGTTAALVNTARDYLSQVELLPKAFAKSKEATRAITNAAVGPAVPRDLVGQWAVKMTRTSAQFCLVGITDYRPRLCRPVHRVRRNV